MDARGHGLTPDRDASLRWLESRFGSVKRQGKNLCVCAPWPNASGEPDKKHHLSVWPEGNCYHNWRPPHNSGSLVSLVVETDGCSFAEAAERLGASPDSVRITADSFQRALQKLEDDGARKRAAREGLSTATPAALPPGFTAFDDPRASGDPLARAALAHLESRGVPPGPFGIGYCGTAPRVSGLPKMDGRVVVPYFDRHGRVVYWTARSVDGLGPKYANPPSNSGSLGKGAALWCSDWSRRGGDVFLVEGALDAVSLAVAGVRSAAIGGCEVSAEQEKLVASLGASRVVLAFDSDEAGRAGTTKAAASLRSRGLRVALVRQPDGYKDWNQLWAAWREPEAFKAWVESQVTGFGFAAELAARLSVTGKRREQRGD